MILWLGDVDLGVAGPLGVRRVETFVVRMWIPDAAADTPHTELQGVVRHVASGTETTFRDADALVAHLRELLRGTVDRQGAR
jgi:hypothetical protein